MSPVQREFRRRFRNNVIAAVILFPFVLIFLRAMKATGETWLTPNEAAVGALVVVAVAAMYAIRTWRCPGCNESLGRAVYPKRCPSCDVELR